MIPKIIHYVWFGNKSLDRLSKKCLRSWEKYCPDYKILRWDENNFDVNFCTYTKEAYSKRKWAFLSDVARLFALVNFGGIYLDTDVELFSNFDSFLVNDAFAGFNDGKTIGTSVLGGIKGFSIYKQFLNDYKKRTFIKNDGTLDQTPNVDILTEMCEKMGFIPNNDYQNILGLQIYPLDYFCAKDYTTLRECKSARTICVHHFAGSWVSKKYRFIRFIGPKATKILVKIKHLILRKKNGNKS